MRPTVASANSSSFVTSSRSRRVRNGRVFSGGALGASSTTGDNFRLASSALSSEANARASAGVGAST